MKRFYHLTIEEAVPLIESEGLKPRNQIEADLREKAEKGDGDAQKITDFFDRRENVDGDYVYLYSEPKELSGGAPLLLSLNVPDSVVLEKDLDQVTYPLLNPSVFQSTDPFIEPFNPRRFALQTLRGLGLRPPLSYRWISVRRIAENIGALIDKVSDEKWEEFSGAYRTRDSISPEYLDLKVHTSKEAQSPAY